VILAPLDLRGGIYELLRTGPPSTMETINMENPGHADTGFVDEMIRAIAGEPDSG
jgi:hypothetical protein